MIHGILHGLRTYRKSYDLITQLRLWKFFAIPILISVITAAVVGLSAWGFSDDLGHWVEQIWPWETGRQAFFIFAEIVSALLIIAIGLILYKHIILGLSAPFMSSVSEKIEAHLKGAQHLHRDTSFQEQLVRGVRISLRNLSLELLITVPILLLNFIPIIGSILSATLLLLTQSYYAGFGNMDYTLERYYTYRESIAFVKAHKGNAIGNGMVFMLFLLLPIIGIILVLPVSVTAATVQTVELLDNKAALNT